MHSHQLTIHTPCRWEAARLGATICEDEAVVAVDRSARAVVTSGGRTLRYKPLVLAAF